MKRLLMVAVLLVTTVGAWLAPGQAVSAQDGDCPVPAIDLITTDSRDIETTIANPMASQQDVIDVTGRGGQVLTLSFDSFIGWGQPIGASTGTVLVDGTPIYSFTRTVESSRVTTTSQVTVPSGATTLTLTFTHTIDDPGEPSGSNTYTFYLRNISLLTPELPCPPPPPPPQSICEQAIAGEGDFAHYEVVYAPAQGGPGNQVVVGGPGSDTLRGGTGHDLLCGLGGNDVLVGGSGNDVLDGGGGEDVLKGNSGNDTLLNGETNRP